MKKFLSTTPIYVEYILSEEYRKDVKNYYTENCFNDLTFDYYCEREGDVKTFKTEVPSTRTLNAMIFHGDIPDYNTLNGVLDYTIFCKGICQSCKENHIQFLLRVFYDKIVDKELLKIMKVGVFPRVQVLPKSEVSKFFDRESNTWYYKGINAIAENYGIGAFAYFRRIIEKELLHIISEIKELPDSHGMEIQILLDEHVQKGTVSAIYENIFKHLPNSLKSLGDNPIKLLYNQTSEGLHSLTDEEALNKSKTIQKLLEFVIIKIYEERSQIKDLKDAIKALKG
jgi:hypothetical protein